MLGADADLRSGEKEGGKALNGSQIETVDSRLWEAAEGERSWYQEDLRSPEYRDGDRHDRRLQISERTMEPRCARPLRPYKSSKRPRKAKGIETYPEYSTASSSETLDNVLPSPNRPVMGPSYTAHDNITSNVTAIGKNAVVSIEEDGTSDVDVEGALL